MYTFGTSSGQLEGEGEAVSWLCAVSFWHCDNSCTVVHVVSALTINSFGARFQTTFVVFLSFFFSDKLSFGKKLYAECKDWMSNSVDPDETAHLDLCCLQKSIIIACGSESCGSPQAKICLRACAKTCGFTSSCACAKYQPGICSPFILSIVTGDCLSGQWRPRSDCVDAQADLGLRCLHMPENTFSLGAAQVSN